MMLRQGQKDSREWRCWGGGWRGQKDAGLSEPKHVMPCDACGHLGAVRVRYVSLSRVARKVPVGTVTEPSTFCMPMNGKSVADAARRVGVAALVSRMGYEMVTCRRVAGEGW